MRIGLLGGSFDPAHEGHVHITKMAMKALGLDRVWWLVSPGNPLKTQGPAPMMARIRQAKAVLHDPAVLVTGIELALSTRLTADTIKALKRHYPSTRFVWLMGADNLVQFDQWERWQEIASNVPICVLARPGARMEARFSKAARILAKYRLPQEEALLLPDARPPAWVMLNIPLSDQSSTAIRAAANRKFQG